MMRRQLQATVNVYLTKVGGKWRLAFSPAVDVGAVWLYYDDDTPVKNAAEQQNVATVVSDWLATVEAVSNDGRTT